MSRQWIASGSCVYLPNGAGGFDLRNCPNPDALARSIVSAMNTAQLRGAGSAETVATDDISDERLEQLVAATLADGYGWTKARSAEISSVLGELLHRRVEMEALQLRNIELRESLTGCAKRVATLRESLNATKADARRLKVSGPDCDGLWWLHIDTGRYKASINLGHHSEGRITRQALGDLRAAIDGVHP